ncbi:MAG: glutaredoxin family protein [Spongiibacteraceae bacterium]
MNQFILYGTLGCHLCDEAEASLIPLLSSELSIEYIDISESDQLIEQYGELIPVLRRLRDDAELRWPFDATQAQMFLSMLNG